jgi:hypothetical protein
VAGLHGHPRRLPALCVRPTLAAPCTRARGALVATPTTPAPSARPAPRTPWAAPTLAPQASWAAPAATRALEDPSARPALPAPSPLVRRGWLRWRALSCCLCGSAVAVDTRRATLTPLARRGRCCNARARTGGNYSACEPCGVNQISPVSSPSRDYCQVSRGLVWRASSCGVCRGARPARSSGRSWGPGPCVLIMPARGAMLRVVPTHTRTAPHRPTLRRDTHAHTRTPVHCWPRL